MTRFRTTTVIGVKPAEAARELLFPLTDLAVLMAIIGFGGLLWLAFAAGLFGLWLAFIVVPATFRYAIYLLESRAHGDVTHVAGIEVFNIADNLWGLFPLLLSLAFAWIEWQVFQTVGSTSALLLLAVFLSVYPASMGVLAITRSPLASISPVDVVRLIGRCGPSYLYIPVLVSLAAASIYYVVIPLLPDFAVYFLAVFLFFLMFSLTGAVVHAADIASDVAIEPPMSPTKAEQADACIAERQKVSSHAYGFISRGNRDGGFQHIRDRIADEADPDAAVSWFFSDMMTWENKQAALFFGQECFAHFLHHGRDAQALKIVSRCLHEDPAWRPRREDAEAAALLAERNGRDDLLPALRR